MSTPPFPGHNPYQSPSASLVESTGSAGPVTEKTLEMLRLTKPWVRLFSVLGFLGAVFGVLAGIGIGVMSFARRGGTGPTEIAVAGVYVLMGLFYFPPALFLFRYATRIGELLQTRTVADLESALEAQKSFWRFIGTLTAVALILYLVGIVAVVFLGAARNM